MDMEGKREERAKGDMAEPLIKIQNAKGKAGFDGVRNVCIQEVFIWKPVGKPPCLAKEMELY